jgi:hypothetical protein
MHYLIGLITAVAMLIFALSRLQRAGLDLNALNPFLWYRRAQWKKLYAELGKVLERGKRQFTPEQVESTVDLMQRLSWLDGEPNGKQAKLIDNTKQILAVTANTGGTWN